MKSISRLIFEAQNRPSALKKYKDTSKVVNVEFKSGDLFDNTSGTYTDKFKYYSGEGDGYITDKNGNVYDVITKEWHDDAGAIAGATYNISTAILKVLNGKTDIVFSGWSGVYSSPSSPTYDTIKSDIKDGIHLEDYIAKHWQDLNNRSSLSDNDTKALEKLKNNGDPDAQTYNKNKQDSKEQKRVDFYTRYLCLPHNITFTVKDGKVSIDSEYLVTTDDKSIKRTKPGLFETPKITPEGELQVKDRVANVVEKLLLPKIIEYLNNIFKNNISKISLIEGTLSPVDELPNTWTRIALDTKKNSFAIIDIESNKVVQSDYENGFKVSDAVKFWKSSSNEYTKNLFRNASQAWLKANKNTQAKYVADTWEAIWKQGNSGYWNKMTKTEAKKIAKEQFEDLLRDHNFERSNYLAFPFELLKDFLEDNIKTNEAHEWRLEETEVKESKLVSLHDYAN